MNKRLWIAAGFAAAATLSFATFPARAKEKAAGSGLTLTLADPTKQGDGTLGAAAKAAIEHGPLPFSDADVAAKAAANRASKAAEKSGVPSPLTPDEFAPAGKAAGARTPVIVGGINKAGLGPDTTAFSPPDTTGAIGPSSYIQLVNATAGIFDRTTGALVSSGTLDELANIASTVTSFDPQIIWDPATNRFYYAMDSIVSATENQLSIGFSKTAAPGNVTTDWCHYTVAGFGSAFPDYPKLGDSGFFLIIGVNVFGVNQEIASNQAGAGFAGSDLIVISKPPDGTTCPSPKSFIVSRDVNLVDSTGKQVFTPVPANQVDLDRTGYVVARNGTLPSNMLWFFNVTADALGFPHYGSARGVTVGNYAIPPAATQPGFTQLLDTGDARNTQAVQAVDPRLGPFAFWTQHTIASADGTVSVVRAYEIDPSPATPVVLRSGTISRPNMFLFNAAISPDRRHDGFIKAFGDSFVIEGTASSGLRGFNPRIVAGSSVAGGPLSTLLIKQAVGPYRDGTCVAAGSTCRWGDYSAATPDPRPITTGRGVVWGTNQFSGLTAPPPSGANWRTQIFAVEP